MNKSLWQDILINIPSFLGSQNNSMIIRKSHCSPSCLHIFLLLVICLMAFDLLTHLPIFFLDFMDNVLEQEPYRMENDFVYASENASRSLKDIFLLIFIGRLFYILGFSAITGWTEYFIRCLDFCCVGFLLYSLGWAIFSIYNMLAGIILVMIGLFLFLISHLYWEDHMFLIGNWKNFTDAFEIGSYCIDSAQKEDEETEECIRSRFLIIKEYGGVGLFEFKESISETSFESLLKELQDRNIPSSDESDNQ